GGGNLIAKSKEKNDSIDFLTIMSMSASEFAAKYLRKKNIADWCISQKLCAGKREYIIQHVAMDMSATRTITLDIQELCRWPRIKRGGNTLKVVLRD
ncbi:MAG: hypothetical protein NC489_17770, partial [Ruminococcus flavefaciens]|nr:hypothetical protein [Ruminococcus flavefaciens]